MVPNERTTAKNKSNREQRLRDSETAAVCVQPINVIILKEQSCVIKSFLDGVGPENGDKEGGRWALDMGRPICRLPRHRANNNFSGVVRVSLENKLWL